jgi:hypothetical protein
VSKTAENASIRFGSRSKLNWVIANDESGGVMNSCARAPAISVELIALGVVVADVPSFH